jgi:hypothetical protein
VVPSRKRYRIDATVVVVVLATVAVELTIAPVPLVLFWYPLLRTAPDGPHALILAAVPAGQPVRFWRLTPVIVRVADATAGTAAINMITAARLQTNRPIDRE